MKAPFLPNRGLCSFVAALALLAVPTLHAVAGDHEILSAKFALAPTVNAPLGAVGNAQLHAIDKDSVTQAQLKIQTKGLLPATYTVNGVLKSDTTSVALGTFVVTGTTITSGTSVLPANPKQVTTVLIGGTSQPFPNGFDPFQLATVSIADPNAVIDLSGDVASGQSSLNVIESVVPGVAAPNATGKLMIQAVRKNGKDKTVIHLFVGNVPPNLAFTVNVNGVAIAQGTSDKHGKIRLGQTPGKHKGFAGFGSDLNGFDIQTISLTDSNAELLLSVSL